MLRAPFRTAARATGTALLATVLLAACGRGDADAADADTAAADTSAAAATAAPAPTPAPDAAPTPLTVADIDRWERGMAAELEAVKAAGARLRQATSGADSAAAIGEMTEGSTLAAGASAAGVDEERYRRLRSELAEVVEPMSPLEQEMDVSKMPASMVAEMRKGREDALARVTAALPADLVEALRPRAAALRTQQKMLVDERLKAAGVGR